MAEWRTFLWWQKNFETSEIFFKKSILDIFDCIFISYCKHHNCNSQWKGNKNERNITLIPRSIVKSNTPAGTGSTGLHKKDITSSAGTGGINSTQSTIEEANIKNINGGCPYPRCGTDWAPDLLVSVRKMHGGFEIKIRSNCDR